MVPNSDKISKCFTSFFPNSHLGTTKITTSLSKHRFVVFFTGYQDGQLQVMCLATGSEVHTLDEHKDLITGISSSADGTFFALATASKDVYIYNLKTREVMQKLGGHTGAITNVAVTRDGFFVLTSSLDGIVRVWNLPKEPQGELTLNVHQGDVTCTGECCQELAGYKGADLFMYCFLLSIETHCPNSLDSKFKRNYSSGFYTNLKNVYNVVP